MEAVEDPLVGEEVIGGSGCGGGDANPLLLGGRCGGGGAILLAQSIRFEAIPF